MNPGLLSEPVELLFPLPDSPRDSYNQQRLQYSGSMTFARVVRKNGDEVISNGITTSGATYTFMVRYRTDIDEKTKIRYSGKDYNITFVGEQVPKQYLLLTANREKNR